MDQRLNKIEDKIDALDNKLDQLVVATIQNTRSLEEHMRRTDAVEKRNDLLEQSLQLHRQEVAKEIAPIKIIADRIKFSVVFVTGFITLLYYLKHLGLF